MSRRKDHRGRRCCETLAFALARSLLLRASEGGSHEEYIGAYQERWKDWYHLGVFALDIVLQKHRELPSGEGRWKLR